MSKAQQRNCYHINTKIEVLPAGSHHKSKRICADCSKFMSWWSLKSTEERVQDRKRAIREYYLKNPQKDKFRSINDYGYLFSDDDETGTDTGTEAGTESSVVVG
jgi:hypothetical protein